MRILVTGNPERGLAKELFKLYPSATFISRSTGHDLTTSKGQEYCANLALKNDVIINCSALWKFNQTVLLDAIYKKCAENKHRPHIVCIGSTTDRVKNGKVWIYNAEKKALRDYCNTLGLNGVWSDGPKLTLVSLGSLSNVQAKHPDRTCLDIEQAATYIKWIIDQPQHICINEISIDPVQVTNG
jgi:NADP-dependent 3-hydroxy acid dehydrogenase YdfG